MLVSSDAQHPSGLGIDRSLRERLERYSQQVIPIDFRRIAVTAEQIRQLHLIAHDANRQDTHYRRFVTTCQEAGLPVEAVEVEAIPSSTLRDLLKTSIYDLVEDADTWNATIDAEDSEREIFARMAGEWSL